MIFNLKHSFANVSAKTRIKAGSSKAGKSRWQAKPFAVNLGIIQ
jgi:hypothetical protein